MKLSKKDFIELMAEKCDCTKTDAKYWVEAIFDGLTTCLAEKNDVNIFGFGTFMYQEKEASMAHNPLTGESVEVPAHGAVRFKVAKGLKDAVR